ncbi:MAG: hypothetical protein QF578_18800 [Alphaproteobacteria bacterium]|nr:hypothetical protein [Alphaproteobacteria bacterium]
MQTIISSAINRIMGTLAVCLMIGGTNTTAHAVVIDFDNLASSVQVTNQYAEATFSALALPGHAAPIAYNFSGFNNSTPNGLVGWNGVHTSFNSDLGFVVDFTNPVNNLSFLVFGDNNAGAIANLGVHTTQTRYSVSQYGCRGCDRRHSWSSCKMSESCRSPSPSRC